MLDVDFVAGLGRFFVVGVGLGSIVYVVSVYRSIIFKNKNKLKNNFVKLAFLPFSDKMIMTLVLTR